MSDLQERLLDFAVNRGVPHVLTAEGLQSQSSSFALLLVGSVAAGTCGAHSDVDIAIVCDEIEFARMSAGKRWSVGRPSELVIDGVQLHYYGIAMETILAKIGQLDDTTLYVYSQARPLVDLGELYVRRLKPALLSPQVRTERIEGKLDMLIRRCGVLRHCAAAGEDPMVLSRISLEILTLCLKTAALLDDVPFDPRKRLWTTCLTGPVAQRLRGQLSQMLEHASGWLGGPGQSGRFLLCLDDVVAQLATAAKAAGFSVGLPRPDARACEG